MPTPLSDAELVAMESRAASLAFGPTPDASLCTTTSLLSAEILAVHYASDVLRLVAEVRRLRELLGA